MLREIDLAEISDGKLYESNDMAKTNCNGCIGCCDCCKGMGDSIILDPFDIWHLTAHLSKSFEELLADSLELNVADGIILPNLRMSKETEQCIFLDSKGRCSIHTARPGFCRLFPLGRYYENRSFKYFLQIHECPKANRTKIKIKKWLNIENLKQYEKYITDWHYYLKEKQETAMASEDAETVKRLSMGILKQFYLMPYEKNTDFYTQFYERLNL